MCAAGERGGKGEPRLNRRQSFLGAFPPYGIISQYLQPNYMHQFQDPYLRRRLLSEVTDALADEFFRLHDGAIDENPAWMDGLYVLSTSSDDELLAHTTVVTAYFQKEPRSSDEFARLLAALMTHRPPTLF